MSSSLFNRFLIGLALCCTLTCVLQAQDSCRIAVAADHFFTADKGRHLVGSFMITVLAAETSQHHFNFPDSRSKSFGVGIAFSVGLGKEFHDATQAANRFSWKDLAADITGIIIGILVLGMT